MLMWVLEKLGGVIWTGLTWLRIGTSRGLVVNKVMNLRVPLNVGKFLSILYSDTNPWR
jgi:hypothetical protein